MAGSGLIHSIWKGQKLLDTIGKRRQVALDNTPYGVVLYHRITVNQDIPKRDNSLVPGDLFCDTRVDSVQLIQCLTNNFKLTLNGRAEHEIVLIVVIGLAIGEIAKSSTRYADVI
jgi:hypothetical protein